MLQSMNAGACAPDNRVVRLRAACKEAGISISTMRRLVRDKRGPRLLQLSARCYGVRRSDFEAWLESRETALKS